MRILTKKRAAAKLRRLGIVVRDTVQDERIRASTLQAIPYWAAAVITALAAVAYAKIFGWFESLAEHLFSSHPGWLFGAAPLAFLGSWYLVHRFSPEASGSGIPQVMAAVSDHHRLGAKLLSIRSVGVKVASSCTALLGGGAIGREGPTLQIAATIFFQIGRRLPSFWPPLNLSALTLAGGAAGLAAAFNTPLGGIAFAVEELAKTQFTAFRTPMLHAVLVAGLVAQLILGPYLYLGFPRVGFWDASQLSVFLVTGITIGLAGALYGKLLYAANEKRERLKSVRQRAVFALGCGLAFALLVFLCGSFAQGSGKELISHLLFTNSETDWKWTVGRLLGNLVSITAGGAGGIFAPALASGAALGSELHGAFPQANGNLMILLGMIAFLTGVTHSPLTSFLLVLEMSDRHSAIFPMMITALSAYTVARFVDQRSFYEKVRQRLEEKWLSAANPGESPSKKGEPG